MRMPPAEQPVGSMAVAIAANTLAYDDNHTGLSPTTATIPASPEAADVTSQGVARLMQLPR